MKLEDLRSKRIGILGFDKNNRGITKWLVRHSFGQVTVLDEGSVEWRAGQSASVAPTPDSSIAVSEWRLGADAFRNLTDFDILVRTPGVRLNRPELLEAKNAGVVVISQTRLFFDLCPANIIGVTGTKGKGTTASLISAMFQADTSRAGKCYLAGNIGVDPFDFLDDLTADDTVILELSSFQLQDLDKSPHIAVVLNVTSDHLDYHGTREEYVSAKTPIATFQTPDDFVVVNADSPSAVSIASHSAGTVIETSRTKELSRGVFIQRDEEGDPKIILRMDNDNVTIVNTSELQLRGEHNLENATAAVGAAHAAQVSLSAIQSVLRSFSGYEHRLQLVGRVRGVACYDDSAATSSEPVIAAVQSFTEPVHLIVGGARKDPDFSALGRAIVASSVQTVTPLGDAEATKIVAAIEAARTGEKPVILPTVFDMKSAVLGALDYAKSGDVVLLSPAATGFDLFKSYADRGSQFSELVRTLDHKEEQQ